MFNFFKSKTGLSRKETTFAKKLFNLIQEKGFSMLFPENIRMISNDIYYLSAKRNSIKPIGLNRVSQVEDILKGDMFKNLNNQSEIHIHKKFIEIIPSKLFLAILIKEHQEEVINLKSVEDKLFDLIKETSRALKKMTN